MIGIILIAPSGLLLEIPHLFAVQVSVLWVGLHNSKYRLCVDVNLSFASTHTEISAGDARMAVHKECGAFCL